MESDPFKELPPEDLLTPRELSGLLMLVFGRPEAKESYGVSIGKELLEFRLLKTGCFSIDHTLPTYEGREIVSEDRIDTYYLQEDILKSEKDGTILEPDTSPLTFFTLSAGAGVLKARFVGSSTGNELGPPELN